MEGFSLKRNGLAPRVGVYLHNLRQLCCVWMAQQGQGQHSRAESLIVIVSASGAEDTLPCLSLIAQACLRRWSKDNWKRWEGTVTRSHPIMLDLTDPLYQSTKEGGTLSLGGIQQRHPANPSRHSWHVPEWMESIISASSWNKCLLKRACVA